MAKLSVDVEWKGLDELVAFFESYGETVPQRVSQTYERVGGESKSLIVSFTPVRTGKLKGGNEVETKAYGFTLSNDVEYAPYVNYGTRYQTANPFFDRGVEWAEGELDQRLPATLDVI